MSRAVAVILLATVLAVLVVLAGMWIVGNVP
jgi:hypothetical protein